MMVQYHGSIDELLGNGDYISAAKSFVRLYRESKDYKYIANLATCCYKLKKLHWARYFCLKALTLSNGESLDAQLTFANLTLDQGEHRKAVSLYRKLLSTSHAIHGYLGIAAALKYSNKLFASRTLLERLVADYPEDYRSHLYLGTDELEKGRYDKAWICFHNSLILNQLCLETWEKSYWCARGLEEYPTAFLIAKKLVEKLPKSSLYATMLGNALIALDRPLEACDSFSLALEANPSDVILYLNSRIPFYRIPVCGSTANQIASTIVLVADEIHAKLKQGVQWFFCGDQALVNFLFFTAYSSLNLKKIFNPYFRMLSALAQPVLVESIQLSAEMQEHWKRTSIGCKISVDQNKSKENSKIRLGMLSQNFYAHSNTQAFKGMIKYLRRDLFEVVIIHASGTVPDAIQAQLNEEADEVVYLSTSLSHTHMLLTSLELDILFFTDIGMDPFDFLVPLLGTCPIQISGWGLPHTTGLNSIDYYLSSSLLESTHQAEEYTEKLVLLDGLPCCFLSEFLHYQSKPKQYFMLPDDRVVIGCVQTLIKIHPDLDLIIESIAKRLPDVLFVFVSYKDTLDPAFLARLAKRAPIAFQRTLLIQRCPTTEFLALCDCIDILLDTPYYGAGITAYMAAYVGTPNVCFKGSRLRDSTSSAIYKYLGVANAPVAGSIHEYIEKVVELARDFDLRLQIKKDTVAVAHRLYDNQEYIRSFESFCFDVLGRSMPLPSI